MTFRILGEIPWGGRKERPVLGAVTIAEGQRKAILAECVKLMRTAEAAAGLPRLAKAKEMGACPIAPAELEEGIRNMEGGYKLNDEISALDVMFYACRVVDRLLAEVGVRPHGSRDGGYTNSTEAMAARTHEIAVEVYAAASAAGISV